MSTCTGRQVLRKCPSIEGNIQATLKGRAKSQDDRRPTSNSKILISDVHEFNDAASLIDSRHMVHCPLLDLAPGLKTAFLDEPANDRLIS